MLVSYVARDSAREMRRVCGAVVCSNGYFPHPAERSNSTGSVSSDDSSANSGSVGVSGTHVGESNRSSILDIEPTETIYLW